MKITSREKRRHAAEERIFFFSLSFLIFLSPRRVSSFPAWGDFHARSRFARSTPAPEEKWGTTRSLGKWVCCAYQKRRNVAKVGRPTEKRTFRCPRGRRIFLHKSFALRAEQRLETAPGNCTAMLSQIREELNTPTDNEQLLRLKRMSKSPHSNPRLGNLAL